jgi:transcriptional repressor NrdR
MFCPFCQKSETKVIDSRLIKGGFTIRRRRSCPKCERRFTTYEKFKIAMPKIIKNDGRREEYDREKIFSGIEKACQKRPISSKHIEKIIENIEKSIFETGRSEVSARDIGQIVMIHLRHLDPVALIRFASVYKSFHNIDDFYRDLKIEEDQFRFLPIEEGQQNEQ